MQRAETSCPYCGTAPQAGGPGQGCEPWASENGWTAVRCPGCGVVYLSPRPGDLEISESTQLGLHRIEAGQGQLDVRGQFQPRRVQGLKRRLVELFPPPTLRQHPLRWLDVGAGFGELVAAVSELTLPGSTIEGLEPCVPKVHDAQRRGLAVRTGSLSDVHTKYDFVSAVNVLSHVPHPHEFVSSLCDLLVPGGTLLLVTGNGADIRGDEYPQVFGFPDHLLFLGERHLRGLYEHLGMTSTKIHAFRTSLPRARIFDSVEDRLSRLLGRHVGYSGPFRSLWAHGTKPTEPVQ